ncbi:MAG: hypothetical protein KKF46_01000 [Nanoarchaeota archaeon]|nr:hypothetical protein [Nanoarchaeota archaeon]MBU1320911.1 hypothetical protein [Nanoarchaeota archaeon]MBU1597564.1 hypothetical protein [Nanoarchaeota archaeon]MBU2441933.1 hypothetical protein [Nanoarchaeota archaeon]
MTQDNYFVFTDGKFNNLHLKELAEHLSLPPEIRISTYSNDGAYTNVWSARLSTGLLGLTSCASGNRGPKGFNEVVLSVEAEGLNKLVELGFITCPICHPEKINGFWETVKDRVDAKYNIRTLEDFVDKTVLPFDARRINWEELLPIVGQVPNRLYILKDLQDDDIITLNKTFNDIGFKLPPVGYYNPEVPSRFTEYQVPDS